MVTPNIQPAGRIARFVSGTLCIIAAATMALTAWPAHPVWRWCIVAVLAAAGFFQWYEAKRAWCIARACGLRTPM